MPEHLKCLYYKNHNAKTSSKKLLSSAKVSTYEWTLYGIAL